MSHAIQLCSGQMKQRLFVPFLAVVMMGSLSGKLGAQVPKKFVYIESIGSAPPPAAGSSQFGAPWGVAIDDYSPSPGYRARKFYVADPQNNQVVVFDCTVNSSSHCAYGTATNTLSTLSCPVSVCFWGSPTWTLMEPTFVAVAPNHNIWISDTMNDVVVEVDPRGTVVAFAGAGPNAAALTCTGSSRSRPVRELLLCRRRWRPVSRLGTRRDGPLREYSHPDVRERWHVF